MSEPSVPEQTTSEELVPEPGTIGPGGVMLVQVGDRQYPARHVPQCKICRSKYRTMIEQAVIGGMSYPMVVKETVDPYQDHSQLGTPTHQGLLRHVRNKHMPVPYSVQRTIIEERANELGRSVEEGEKLLVDSVSILRMVTQRGFERLNSGEIQPNMTDLMAALKLQSALMGEQGGESSEDLYVDALYAYMDVVQRHVDHETLQKIGRDLAKSPAIKALSRRRNTVAGEIES